MSKFPPELKIKSKINQNRNILSEKKNKLRYKERMFVNYIVGGIPLEETAEKLGLKLGRCKKWLRNEKILQEIERKVEARVDLDAKKRKKRSENIASEIYMVLVEKIAKGSLKRMNTKNLLRILGEMNKDIRADTPGENTKTINHNVLVGELSDRYNAANSSKYDASKAIIQMNLPKQIAGNPKEEEVYAAESTEQEISEADYERVEGNRKTRAG